jgi:aspartyl-tRNA(Asn)/glutamyl-tRNA(Gln) amidotransferase subunit A
MGMDFSTLGKEVARLDRQYGFMAKVVRPEASKNRGRLSGVAVSVKDCICVKGVQSAAGSRVLEGYEPPFDATCIEKVKGEGGVIIGKTNQDEFGFGTFAVNSGFAVPKNPLDPSRSCGGSSGGAAGLTAALPESMRHIALAESTGGSISCPASFCGVAGLTPTYGLVSRYGLIDYANSLDKIGAMAKSVKDAALMLSVIAGHDERDSTSLNQKSQDYTRYIGKNVKGMKIGVPKEYFGEGVDKAVAGEVWKGIKRLESEGATYRELSLPMTKSSVAVYYIIACAEASTNLAKYCGLRYGAAGAVDGREMNEYFSDVRTRCLGDEAKRRILLGTYARMAGYRDQYYLKAMKARTLIINEFRKAFAKCDILAAPTMPVVAPKFKEIEKLPPIEQYMMDILTIAPNLAGIPMLSVPCGKAHGMPVGIHFMANHMEEGKVIQVGSVLEDM